MRRATAKLVVVLGVAIVVLGGTVAGAAPAASASGADVLAPGGVHVGVTAGFDLPTPLGLGAVAAVGLPLGTQLGVSVSSAWVTISYAAELRARLVSWGGGAFGASLGLGQITAGAPTWARFWHPALCYDWGVGGRYGFFVQAGALLRPRGLEVDRWAVRAAAGGRMIVLGGASLLLQTGLLVFDDGDAVPIGGAELGWSW